MYESPEAPSQKGDIISFVRVRSPSEITCQLGKRRFVVKEGDWWIRNEDRWHLLKTTEELEAFLLHQFSGELFIFEKIENSKGKIVLTARSFDRMRTEFKSLSFVFNIEKKPLPHHRGVPSLPQSSLLAQNNKKEKKL